LKKMNAETSDHQENSVAVAAKLTVIQTHALAHKLASNARYVTAVLIASQDGYFKFPLEFI